MGLAAVGLRVGGGSIAYARSTSPTPAWSTAQALLGLTRKSRLLAKEEYASGDNR